MSVKSICYLFETPFLESYYIRYGIDIMRRNGYNVQILDLSPFLLPNAYNKVVNLANYEEKGIERCMTIKEMKYKFDTMLYNPLLILVFGYNYRSYPIYKEIYKKNYIYGYLSQDTNIELNEERTFADKVKQFVQGFTINRLIQFAFMRMPQQLLKLRYADFIILGGNANKEEYMYRGLCSSKTKIKYIHSLDFDTCITCINNERIVKERYGLFIDQYIPYHPDGISLEFNINPEKYYKEIRDFFKLMEEKTNMPIIIAVHPRSNYEKYTYAYDGYRYIKFKTCELIRDAEYVFTHHSTSISYVALFKKPLFFISTNDINSYHIQKQAIQLFAQRFNNLLINISDIKAIDDNLLDKMFRIDEAAYNKYIYNYIKTDFSGDFNVPVFWEQFCEYIKKEIFNDE